MKLVASWLAGAWLAVVLVASEWSESDGDDDTEKLESVDAVLGRSAELPCDIKPTNMKTADRFDMVLWYRIGDGKPIYTFDVRGRPMNQALRLSDPNAFGPRGKFDAEKGTVAALQLESIQLKDAGVYRCRVDFRYSPSRNLLIKLTVIVPPHQLIVFDNSGRELSSDMVGPLTEESDLHLTCEVRGGYPQSLDLKMASKRRNQDKKQETTEIGEPPPNVTWFVNDEPFNGQIDRPGPKVIVNKLSMTRIKRDRLNSTFKCLATNTKLMQPTERSLRLEMYLRPISVRLTSKPETLIADQEYTIGCQAIGSRPQAEITWLRENKKFRRGKVETWSNESVVSSRVVFSPAPEDDRQQLKCQAVNPSIASPPLEDYLTLNVVYSPLVTLQLGTSLKPHQIKEGDDVYFECNVKANPKEHKISWYHNGEPVTQNMWSGVLFSTQSLVLQKVTRQNAGSYTCAAANDRGQTSSQQVNLRIQYAPVCAVSDSVMVGASIDEAVRVRCVVSADPPDVSFVWQFNNSGESFPVAPHRYAPTNGTVSELVYTPNSERDYGTLACWATNSIGRQADPCTFQVVPATKPGPLHNCTLRSTVNTTGDWLEIECVAGFDGGLAQTFHLEAVDSASSKSCLNATSVDGPFFRVELAALATGHPATIQLIIYASNQKGRSELVVLEDIAIRDAEKRTEWVRGSDSLSGGSLAALLVGGLLSVASLFLLVTICALKRRSRRMQLSITTPTKQIEITQGDDQRYVVAYQLKPETKQPDILSRVSDEPLEKDIPQGMYAGPGVMATFMSPCNSPTCSAIPVSPSFLPPQPIHNGILSTTQHILSNSIPGPESCV